MDEQRQFEDDFLEAIADMERQIESTRQSEILSAKDYAVTINCRGDELTRRVVRERREHFYTVEV